MRIFKIILLTSLIVIFGGCGEQPTIERIVTVTKEVKVYVPTKPKRTVIKCYFDGEGAIPIGKMMECIALQKRYIEKITIE